MVLNGLTSYSWSTREWAIKKERSGLSIGACSYSYHLYFYSLFSCFRCFLTYFFCFLSFPFGTLPPLFGVVVYYAHLCLFILHFVARFTIFTPQLLWACCVCSFKITTLVYQLPNHHYYSVLAVPHFIPKQKWFLFCFLSSLGTLIQIRPVFLPYQPL